MALPTRENVLNALVALLDGVTFASPVNNRATWAAPVARRVREFERVPPDQQPAAFLYELEERDSQRHLGAPLRQLMPRLLVYASCKDQESIGGSYLNIILEGVEAALRPNNLGRGTLTLGGIAYWVRIDGTVLKIPGDMDGQAVMLVPITITMP